MTWDRFNYICRKARLAHKAEETLCECISRVESEQNCRLYGGVIENDSISREILRKIRTMPQKEALAALDIYSQMDVSQTLSEPIQFRRITFYLACVTVVFLVISTIYQFRVAPSFLHALKTFELAEPSFLIIYRDYSLYFVLVILIILTLNLIVAHTLKRLFKFKRGSDKSVVFRLLAYKGIKESYLRLLEIISYPIIDQTNTNEPNKTQIMNHLSEIEKSGMNLAMEMQTIIRIEAASLLHYCERQMQIMSIFVAVIIVLSIFSFLVGAYSPIFILGETI